MSRAKYFSSVTLVKSNAKALSAEPKAQCALRGGLRYLLIPLLYGTYDAVLPRPIFQRVKSTESLSPLAPLTSARNGRLYKVNQEKPPCFSTQSFSGSTTSFRRRYFSKTKRKKLLPMGFRVRPECEFAAANSVLAKPYS